MNAPAVRRSRLTGLPDSFAIRWLDEQRRVPVNTYPALVVLSVQQVRDLMTIESSRALALAQQIGLEAPCDQPTT